MLTSNTFYTPYDQIYYFYRHWQSVYDNFIKSLSNIEFIPIHQGGGIEIIETVVDRATSVVTTNHDDNNDVTAPYRTMLIFDDIAEELLASDKFSNLATSGRHKNLSIIFIKHNLYQQGKHSVTIDKTQPI